MKQKAREWQYRIVEDLKVNKEALFVCFTFSIKGYQELNEKEIVRQNPETKELEKIKIADLKGYAKDNAIAAKGMRYFLELWRKHKGKSLRHWAVTEIGGNNQENIHIHAIVWTKEREELERLWRWGIVWSGNKKNEKVVNYVNARTANYIVKPIS